MYLDESSKRSLTAETKDPVSGNIVSAPCDLDGNPLGAFDPTVTILDEPGSGKTWARVAAVKPTQKDPLSLTTLKAIEDRSPVFVDSADGSIRGWYAKAGDFSFKARSKKPDAPVAPVAPVTQ